jgi:argininosuccinate lyase
LESGKNRLWDKGESLNRDIHAFTVGNDPEIDLNLLPWDILASAAHARMLTKEKLIPASELPKLLSALKEAYQLSTTGEFIISQDLEDCHTALEVFLTEKCGEAGKRIHTARSRNDQVMVAMRLFLKNELLQRASQLVECIEITLSKATPSVRTQIPGYTHFQQAMPASIGMWYASIAETALELLRESFNIFDLINNNPLGAGSGFYTTIPIDRDLTSTLMKFNKPQRNPIHIQNSRGRHETKVARLLSDISWLIEKYSSDMIFYSISETDFLKIPMDFTTGSSIMPQKRNPDVLELLRGQTSKVRACQFELESITAKLPSHYHRDFQLTKEPLIKASEMTRMGIQIFNEVLKRIDWNLDILEKAKTPELYATYHAYRLVKEGVPFREAYLSTAKDLKEGIIDIKSLEKDFEVIAARLEHEISVANMELNALKADLGKKIQELKSLPDSLLCP